MDTGSRSSAQSALLSSTRAKMTAEDAPGHRQQQQQQHERLPPPVLEGILKTKQQPFGQRTHSVGQAGSILAERSRLPQVKKHASFALTHTHVSGNQSGTNNQSVSGHTHNLSFDMATTNSSNSGATVSSGANKCVSSVHTGALVETAKSQSPAGNTISVGSNSNQLTNDNTANDNNSNNNTNTNQASYYQRRLSLAGLGRRQRAVTMDNNVEFVGQKLAATTTSSKARPEKKPSLSTPDAKSLRSSVAVGVGVKDKDKGKDNSNKDLGIVRAIGLKIASGRSINNDTALAGVGGKKPLTKSRTTSSSKYSATKQPSRALSLSKSFMSSSSSSSLLSSSSEPLDSLSLDSSNSTTFTLTSDDEDTARDVLSRRRFKLNNEQLRLQRKCTPYTYTDADGILVTDLDSISLINTSSESESGPSNETSSASGNDDDTLALSESRPAIISEVVKQPGVNEITSNTNNNTADTNARNIDDNRKDVATTADCQQPQQEQQLQSASCQVSNKVSVSTANEQQKQQQAESNVPVSSSLRNKVVKRSRYAWCPANLTKEHIGAFFAKFPKDKVPLIDTPGDEYRTRQIDYQLPAQDMALEYCKYVDTNDARHSYHEFITQRSTKALDVGHAVRLIDAKYRATSPTDMDSTLVVSSSSSSSSSCSTTSNGSSVVKCRRCLCQINNIAVVAPKFLVGTSLASSVTPVSASSSTLADGSGHSKKTDNGQAVPPAGIEQLTNTDAARRLSNSGIQAPLSTGIFHPECFTCYTCKEWLVGKSLVIYNVTCHQQ
ncbi:Protein prickle, partial [Fragariocoptes setiger]